MNNEILQFLEDFLTAAKMDIKEAAIDFDSDDFMRVIAAAQGFGSFIQKVIEEKKHPDDAPLKGKI